MTNEQIIDAGINYTMSTRPVCMGGDAFEDMIRRYNRNPSFEAGAKWAKEELIKEITQWLLEELFEDESELNIVSDTDVKSKRYDTVIEFIEALKNAMEQ